MSTVTFSMLLLPVPLNARTHTHEETAAWLLADSRSHPPSGMTTVLAPFAWSDSRKPSAPRHCWPPTESPYRKIPQMQFCADLSYWALVEELEDFNKQATLWKYVWTDSGSDVGHSMPHLRRGRGASRGGRWSFGARAAMD
jgi:hypothetical protein